MFLFPYKQIWVCFICACICPYTLIQSIIKRLFHLTFVNDSKDMPLVACNFTLLFLLYFFLAVQGLVIIYVLIFLLTLYIRRHFISDEYYLFCKQGLPTTLLHTQLFVCKY